MSWYFYPEDRFSSYDEYITYLKEKGWAFDAPEPSSDSGTIFVTILVL